MSHTHYEVRRTCSDGPTCLEPSHMVSELVLTDWGFGTVIRVDPANERVPQPDDRRWLILSPADTSAARPWLTLYLGPVNARSFDRGVIRWGSMTGFVRVEEAEA